MFSKILVPLDGSPLAEKALPYAVTLANRFKAKLLLLSVAHAPAMTVDMELMAVNDSKEYLKRVNEELTNSLTTFRLEPEQVQTIVGYGNSAQEITTLAPLEKADLIVMTTHGRTALARLVMGSVAAHVVKHIDIPVVLIHPEKVVNVTPVVEGSEASPGLETENDRVVVSLDGSPEAEAALLPAINLARDLGATVYLMQVVMAVMPMEYGNQFYGFAYDPAKETEKLQEEAYKYLSTVQMKVAEQGVNCVKVVRIGNPSEEIIKWAKEAKATLLVMATHAHGKVGQIVMGSVADEVVRNSHLPVLLVRAGAKSPTLLTGGEFEQSHEKLTI